VVAGRAAARSGTSQPWEGTRLYQALASWLTALGAHAIRLSAVEQNTRAPVFWQRLGFAEIKRHPPRLLGAQESVAVVLRRSLDC
jgi:ribosomal protein S18 acetylase RimI-like enzyme